MPIAVYPFLYRPSSEPIHEKNGTASSAMLDHETHPIMTAHFSSYLLLVQFLRISWKILLRSSDLFFDVALIARIKHARKVQSLL